MPLQQIPTADTYSRYLQQIPTADTYSRYLQQIPTADTYSRYLQFFIVSRLAEKIEMGKNT